jgi:hypothetical protein
MIGDDEPFLQITFPNSPNFSPNLGIDGPLNIALEETEEALSPAILSDAVNAFLDSSEQGHFEDHFIAAL